MNKMNPLLLDVITHKMEIQFKVLCRGIHDGICNKLNNS